MSANAVHHTAPHFATSHTGQYDRLAQGQPTRNIMDIASITMIASLIAREIGRPDRKEQEPLR